MSPDAIKQIRVDFEAGMSYRELAEKHGTSKSAVGRMAKKGGWTKGKQRRKARKAKGPKKAKPKSGTKKRDSGTVGQPEVSQVSQDAVPAHAPVLPDPDLVDEHFQSTEVLQETVLQLGKFAGFGKSIQQLAEGLAKSIVNECCDQMQDGSLKFKRGIPLSKARQAAGLLEQVAKAGDKGINIYRRSRGLYDKQRLEHSGRIEGDRGEDTIATYLGFALQGGLRGSSSVPESVPGRQEQAQDLDSEQADRQEPSRSN